MVVNGSMPPMKVRPHPVAALVRMPRPLGPASGGQEAKNEQRSNQHSKHNDSPLGHVSRFEVKKETCPLREKSGRRASLTTKGESGAFGKERSLKTHLAAHWRAMSGGVAERSGFARRQTPTLAPRASRPPRQPSPRRLRPRNQGTQRTSGRRGRKPTRRPAGSPRTHGSVRRSRRDPPSKNKESARSKLPRAPCNRRRRAPSSP